VISHSEIVSSFEDLLGDYEAAAESDDSLRDIMDQISYALVTYKESVDILAQLNLIARAFPSKSSVTNAGALYVQYREKITTANATIQTGTEVFKEVVVNTKVVDQRGVAAVYEESDRTLYDAYTFDPNDSTTPSETYISNMKIGRVMSADATTAGAASAWTNAHFNNYGFFFFDYDKALYETADIGHYFHIDSVLNLLGKTATNSYFKLTKVRYYRYYEYGEDSEQALISLATEYKLAQDSAPEAESMLWYHRADVAGHDLNNSVAYVQADYDYSDDTCSVNSFLILRNFELARTEGFEGYRMMCFEFQDLQESTVDTLKSDSSPTLEQMGDLYTYDTMWTEVRIRDNTASFTKKMVAAYNTSYETGGGLSDYYDEATTDSNYNEEDDRWTDSFAATQESLYDADPGKAPWVLYPVYYCVFQDLTSKIYDSDMETVKAAAAEISATIHPSYGTVSQFETFFENFEALYDDVLYDIVYPDGDAITTTGNVKKYQNVFALDELMEAAIYAPAPEPEGDTISVSNTSICDIAAYPGALAAGEVELVYSSWPPADGDALPIEDGLTAPVEPWYTIFNDYGSDEGTLYIDGIAIEDGDDLSEYFSLGGEVGPSPGDLATFEASISSTSFKVIIGVDNILTGTDDPTTYLVTGTEDSPEQWEIESNFGGEWSVDESGLYKAADFSYSFFVWREE